MTLPWRKGLLPLAATLALAGVTIDAQALTLGAITVRSSLGQPLRAEIEVPQISSEEAATLSAAMASPAVFDQLGVEFNPALAGTKVTLERRRNGQAYLRVVGNRPVNEPFIGLVVDARWSGGHVMRDYTMLVDPARRAAPAPALAPAATSGAVTRPAISAPKVASAKQVRPTRAGARRSRSAAPAPAAAISGEGGQVTVKRGDTAAGIASRYATPGVSLDQMLVAMLRANPRAFIKGNVNLIRAGAVLNMPSAEQAAAMPRRKARRTVVAQTRDFNAYRRGLASHIAGTSSRVPAASRHASGNVQPQVRDTKAPTPPKDVVVMSRASAPGTAAAKTETEVSRSRQARESAARAKELERNIQQLDQLQSASRPAPAASSAPPSIKLPASVPAPTIKASVPVVPASVAAPAKPASVTPPAVQPSSRVAAVVPPSAPVVASRPASAASVAARAASAPASVASVQLPVPVIELPSQARRASAAAPAKPAVKKPEPKPQPRRTSTQPEQKASSGSSLLLPGLAGLLALLAGYGGWRMYKKKKATALNSDFVGSENASQAPNSWLGSGDGQADSKAGESTAAGGGLSMIYSPSQLDAAGDVDPVAEADVYLAYGRDVQAEEILREALITQPNRTAIHRKLAEIYSKRRDARALEDIAQKAQAISGGSGVDWQAIATFGSELDPDNPLYRGEAQSSIQTPSTLDSQPARHGFGADTVPLSAQSEQPEDSGSLDLDIGDDLNEELVEQSAVPSIEPIAPVVEKPAPAVDSGAALLDFPLDEEVKLDAPAAEEPTPAAPAAVTGSGMLDFDMDELSADPDSRSPEGASTEQPADADENPLLTQLELAKEFHSIGDIDGARKMVQDVIKAAEGKDPQILVRAQRFLAE